MEYLVNEWLERSAVKVARSVLRGGWQSDLLSQPDKNCEIQKLCRIEGLL